jgi:hypothetical protein
MKNSDGSIARREVSILEIQGLEFLMQYLCEIGNLGRWKERPCALYPQRLFGLPLLRAGGLPIAFG